ncbi:hypothetical protein EBR04_07255 [bacterium]|nr:hypothetical protein [bacterium]
MAYRKSFDDHSATPGFFKVLDTIRRKDKVEVERAVLQLDKILAAANLGGLIVVDGKADLAQRRHE